MTIRHKCRTIGRMNIRQHLVTLIDAFAAARGVSGSRVTTLAMGSGNVYRTLTEGGNITLDRVENAIQWFSDNWPEGTDWPEGLSRPAPKRAGEAA